MDSIEKAMEIVNQAREMISGLNEVEFMMIMCMMFDEFAAASRGKSKAPEMAKTVAKFVDEVNKSEGAYLL